MFYIEIFCHNVGFPGSTLHREEEEREGMEPIPGSPKDFLTSLLKVFFDKKFLV